MGKREDTQSGGTNYSGVRKNKWDELGLGVIKESERGSGELKNTYDWSKTNGEMEVDVLKGGDAGVRKGLKLISGAVDERGR